MKAEICGKSRIADAATLGSAVFRLRNLLLGLFLLCFTPGIGAAPKTGFGIEAITPQSLGVWEGARPVLVYNHGVITNSAAPEAKAHSSYIHPLYGLDAEILTGDFPKDHVYHRGLYWAWPHIKIDNQEYDSWSLRGIRTEFQRWLAKEIWTNKAVVAALNGWFVADRQVMTEKVRIEVHPASKESRAIDVELTWSPADRPITLLGAPDKSYGGLTLRFGPRSNTIITVPTGRTTEDLVVTKLPWADFSGDLVKDRLSGAAVFVHSSHPDFPPTWMTRHYGVLAVGWPGVSPRTLIPGQSVTCRYRVWIHREPPEAAKIQEAYEAYRAVQEKWPASPARQTK